MFAGLKLLTGLTFLMITGLKKKTTRAATEPLNKVFIIVLGGIFEGFVAISVIEKPADPLKKNQLSQRISPPMTMCCIELYWNFELRFTS
jgi:hypothetical protein